MVNREKIERLKGRRQEQLRELRENQVPEVEMQERYNGLDRSMAHARNRLIFFVLFAIYCLLAIFGTTDKMIFMESPLSMPLLGIELPLKTFYIFMPILLLALHFNLLYTYEAHKQLLLEEYRSDRMILFRKLHFGFYESILLGAKRSESSKVLVAFLCGVMMLLLYWLAPFTLIAFWFRFADYQDWWITTFHFTMIWISVFIPFFLFRKILRFGSNKKLSLLKFYIYILVFFIVGYHFFVFTPIAKQLPDNWTKAEEAR